ncbi:phosphatidylinositol 4-phosphate 5-kinase MSS4-like protein [Trema orientale]|uniref:Phosphatidylinositol 4-phosphate 5-kinase MSS4-like protein n=1 Tax=Trema orientale TaxID=63057 RepID=A0A2P5EP15_TREOI|nr:phosphatidylinositol 4-phosphate 5-kinase MSS4-like protein [Trema orientale]
MKNTIRCCISCILPCGALDVIRIVHSNGRVEEISGSIRASEVMKAHPKHVLKKPSTSSPSEDGVVPRIVIVPPDAELQRGKIYFLMPAPSPAPDKPGRHRSSAKKKRRPPPQSPTETGTRGTDRHIISNGNGNAAAIAMANVNLLISDHYLSEILSEKLSTQRDRRRGRAGVWRPHLESISESPSDV